ncbi:MAG: hypothetical protein CL608_15665 [Anaerolineaceae bacterium]|nr:hypothetical protein [Anaerolineaceae bacterium]
MYKKIAITLFLAVATLHTVFWLANEAVAAPLDVCPSGCTYATIQSAVDNAMPFDVINVSAETYAENVVISKSLTIHGADPSSTIVDGTDTDSVFTIEGSIAVTLTNLTITNGNASLPTRFGGGIYVESADVTLDNVIVSNNSAISGGGVYSRGGDIIIRDSRIMNNYVSTTSSFASGGGIYVDDNGSDLAQVLIINTAVVNNGVYSAVSAGGGGINSSASSLIIENSLISGNLSLGGATIGSAGGIFVNGDSDSVTKTVTIVNSTISENSADYIGGGIYATNSAEITLANSTIVSNTANTLGGGIFLGDNSSASLRNMLTALNSPQDCVEGGGFFHSHDHNLDSDDTCGLTEANDLPATSPLIGPLQDNGGPTETHALVENSPAINAGSNADCPSQDQRGLIRPQGFVCDIGAYEFDEGTKFAYLPMIIRE